MYIIYTLPVTIRYFTGFADEEGMINDASKYHKTFLSSK